MRSPGNRGGPIASAVHALPRSGAPAAGPSVGPDAGPSGTGPVAAPTAHSGGANAGGGSRRGHRIMILHLTAAAVVALALTAPLPAAGVEPPERWYERSRVESGGKVYAENCAVCHGARGEATPDWRRREPDGSFPPPPLNGTAHTWHHPFGILARQIKFGAPGGGGKMPPFRGRLTDEEIIDVIAWFQSLWPDDIYAQWWEIQRRSTQQ